MNNITNHSPSMKNINFGTTFNKKEIAEIVTRKYLFGKENSDKLSKKVIEDVFHRNVDTTPPFTEDLMFKKIKDELIKITPSIKTFADELSRSITLRKFGSTTDIANNAIANDKSLPAKIDVEVDPLLNKIFVSL